MKADPKKKKVIFTIEAETFDIKVTSNPPEPE